MPSYTRQLIERAKELRQNMTKQERRLWYDFLRNHSLKFYRQRPIGGYIADFYCSELKLIIEIDGEQHKQNIEYDNVRTEYVNSLGFSVIRFTNNEIDYKFENVCERINNFIKEENFYNGIQKMERRCRSSRGFWKTRRINSEI